MNTAGSRVGNRMDPSLLACQASRTIQPIVNSAGTNTESQDTPDKNRIDDLHYRVLRLEALLETLITAGVFRDVSLPSPCGIPLTLRPTEHLRGPLSTESTAAHATAEQTASPPAPSPPPPPPPPSSAPPSDAFGSALVVHPPPPPPPPSSSSSLPSAIPPCPQPGPSATAVPAAPASPVAPTVPATSAPDAPVAAG
ncbi:hypothetical protein Agub_g2801, partial [Astrephomene gubernaculifera]